jgi:hypothetical protein
MLASEDLEPMDALFLCQGYRPVLRVRAETFRVIRSRAGPIRYPGFAHLGPNLSDMANRRPDLSRLVEPCLPTGRPDY